MSDGLGSTFQEVRTLNLPPRQTAGVNRLLREGDGWRVLDAKVVQETTQDPETGELVHEVRVVYVMGQAPDAEPDR